MQLPAFGNVTGTIFGSNGTTPSAFANIQVVAGPDGANGPYSNYLSSDANGVYHFTGVPLGLVKVTAFDPVNNRPAGQAVGALSSAGAALTLDVTLGTAVSACNYGPQTVLRGADGIPYFVGCTGELTSDRSEEGPSNGPYNDADRMVVNGTWPSNSISATASADGRTMTYGPFQLSGVIATRDVFVPAAGGFARFLDTFSNPTAASVTIDVGLISEFSGVVHLIVDPLTNGNTYAVTRSDSTNGSITTGAVGHVFGGPNVAVTASNVVFQHLLGRSSMRWTVTIPAGATVSVMHFSIQRLTADTAGAQAQAEALVNLTDANALAGMTAEQKARVVNFRIQ